MDFTQEDINEIRDKNFPEWRWGQILEDQKRKEEDKITDQLNPTPSAGCCSAPRLPGWEMIGISSLKKEG